MCFRPLTRQREYRENPIESMEIARRLLVTVAIGIAAAWLCRAIWEILFRIVLGPGQYIYGPIPIELVANTLNVESPKVYSSYMSDGIITRVGQIPLYFLIEIIAPPTTITPIVEGLCEGVIYQNYDPFNAVFIEGFDLRPDEKITYPAKVIIRFPAVITAYTSYSPIELERHTSGNVCSLAEDQPRDFLAFSLEQLDSGEQKLRIRFSVQSPVSHHDKPTPTASPFLTSGSSSVFRDEFRINYQDNICIEVDPAALYNDPEFTDNVLGADVEIRSNGRLWPAAFISSDGLLFPRDEVRHTEAERLSFDQNFNYCYRPVPERGHHTLAITIRTHDDHRYEYEWPFETVLGTP